MWRMMVNVRLENTGLVSVRGETELPRARRNGGRPTPPLLGGLLKVVGDSIVGRKSVVPTEKEDENKSKRKGKRKRKKTHHIGHETHQKEKETTEKVLLERWKAMQSTIESVVRQAFAAFAAAVVQSRSVPALPPTHPIETFVCTISSFPAHFHNTPFQSP